MYSVQVDKMYCTTCCNVTETINERKVVKNERCL